MKSKDSIVPGEPADAIANARDPVLLFRNRDPRLFLEARKGWFRYVSYLVLVLVLSASFFLTMSWSPGH